MGIYRRMRGRLDDLNCPLCGRVTNVAKAKPLYGHLVCKKCINGFANRRQFAFVIDAILFNVVTIGPTGIVLGAMAGYGSMTQKAAENTATILLYALLPLFVFRDSFRGESIGKLLLGVQSVREQDMQPSGVLASIKRNAPMILPFVPLIAAIGMMKGHRLGDGWAKTRVVWRKYSQSQVFLSPNAIGEMFQ